MKRKSTKNTKRKCKFNKLSFIFLLCLILGVAWVIVGIVFWLILVSFLKELGSLKSDCYSIYYYLSIVAVTIGIGNITIGFSIRGIQNRNTDKSDDLKNNTEIALKTYNLITCTPDALFVKEVLNDFAKEWGLDAISSTFVDDPNSYYEKYLQLITIPRQNSSEKNQTNEYDFSVSLAKHCKQYKFYLEEDYQKNHDDFEYVMYFVRACANILKQFESLCYQYCNDRVSKSTFEFDILHGIKEILLRGYIVVHYYRMESDLTYLRVSLLKEKNKDNIIIEEV